MLSGRRLRPAASLGVAITLACSVWLCSASGHAQSTSDELGRRHFDSGVAYLEESDYDNALKAFQKAYELSKRPEILLNLATVQERRSDLPSAVAALQGYLEAAPQGEHVETVKLRIQNLEKRIQEQAAGSQAGANPVAAAPPAPSPPPAATESPPPPAPTPAAKPRRNPEPHRLPALISLGVGGVLAGASLATGLIAKAKFDDAKESCSPGCTPDQVSGSRTFAVTSTVLTGGAVLGVGLGVVLLLITGNDNDELAESAPRFDLALAPNAASASAGWSF